MSDNSWTDDELESHYAGMTIEKYAKHIARWGYNVNINSLIKELKRKYPSGVITSADKKYDFSAIDAWATT